MYWINSQTFFSHYCRIKMKKWFVHWLVDMRYCVMSPHCFEHAKWANNDAVRQQWMAMLSERIIKPKLSQGRTLLHAGKRILLWLSYYKCVIDLLLYVYPSLNYIKTRVFWSGCHLLHPASFPCPLSLSIVPI